MEKNNELLGLTLYGFKSSTNGFDPTIFNNYIELIQTIRSVLKKYFTKTNRFCYCKNSYGIKYMVKKYVNEYIPNGLFIYTMYLDGFSIKKDGKNAFFNIKETDIRCLKNAPEILQKISETNINIQYFEKRDQNLKYHFKSIINSVFSKTNPLKKDVIRVISKEIGVNLDTVRMWFNLTKDEGVCIPKDKYEQLIRIFGLND
ncbi:MAG: hypothetical protein M0Q12_02385 [Synergistaceae bacterium]|jgi:hypothetical protein|nr:hypothetical protein [Synergistaceae bacterium]